MRLRGEAALTHGKKGEATEWFKKGEDYIRAAEFFEWEHDNDFMEETIESSERIEE